jgi:hypothetical protein
VNVEIIVRVKCCLGNSMLNFSRVEGLVSDRITQFSSGFS